MVSKDEIIEMAREAGLRDCTCAGTKWCLERFAALVAEKEREACEKECEDQYALALSAFDRAKLRRDQESYRNSAIGARFCLMRIKARKP